MITRGYNKCDGGGCGGGCDTLVVTLCSQTWLSSKRTPPTTRVWPFPESVENVSILPMGSLGCVYHPNDSGYNVMYVFNSHTRIHTNTYTHMSWVQQMWWWWLWWWWWYSGGDVVFTDMTFKQTTPPTTRVRPFPESVGNASILPMGSLGCVYHPNGSRDNVMYVFNSHTLVYTQTLTHSHTPYTYIHRV